MEPLMVTVREAAGALRVSIPTVYRLIHQGRLPLVKIGRASRIPREAVERLVRAPASDRPGGEYLPPEARRRMR